MKKILFPMMLLLLVGAGALPQSSIPVPPSAPFACTSFAVYTDQPLYGMNFDYPEVDVRFTITTSGDKKIFQMEFMQEGEFVPTVGMNNAGLFASCQMLFPEVEPSAGSEGKDVYTWQVYREALSNFNSVADVYAYLQDRRVLHWGVTLHDLIADEAGDAMVVEVGEKENLITLMEGDFLVMTNFPVAEYQGGSYKDVEGAGADRYIAAYENIQENPSAFQVNQALETLELALSGGEWPTQASMVFDPLMDEVFIALKGDFTRIWKVSIEDEIIETHAGFGEAFQMPFGPSGVLASDLAGASAVSGLPWGIAIALVIVIVGVGVFLLARLRRGDGWSEQLAQSEESE